MLLERTTLERHLAEIVASSMPGHGGGTADSPGAAQPERGPDPEPEPDEDESEEQPS
jgi:hypothetical protein